MQLYAVEIGGRLHRVFIVELENGTTPTGWKCEREPMAPEVEDKWRSSPLLRILASH